MNPAHKDFLLDIVCQAFDADVIGTYEHDKAHFILTGVPPCGDPRPDCPIHNGACD